MRGTIQRRLGAPLEATLRLTRARMQLAASSPYVRWSGAAAVFIVSACLILWGYRDCGCFERQYDDAYITFRYAHNLASGRGLVFNPGDPTDSASSFLYTLLLAGCDLIGLHNLPRAALSIGIGSAACIAALVYLACLERTRRPILALLLGLGTSTHGLISYWSMSGMETLFFSALVCAAVYRLFVRNAFGWTETALVLAVMLTRFEGALLLAAWGCVGLVHFARADHTQRSQLARMALTAGAALGAFFALKYALYRTLLPHAFMLKTITTLYAPNPASLWQTWHDDALALLVLAGAGLFALPRRWQSAAWAVYILASLASLAQGPSADYARYSVHMLPLAMMLASVPLSQLLSRQLPLAILALGALGHEVYSTFNAQRASVGGDAGHAQCRREVGEFMERNLPPGTLVLSSDIGVIAYSAPSIHFIDAVGLTSKDVLQARMDGQNADAVLSRLRPLYVADTCGDSLRCNRIEDFAAHRWLTQEHYWRTPLPEQRYLTQMTHGKSLFMCRSPDDLSFSVTRFKLPSGP